MTNNPYAQVSGPGGFGSPGYGGGGDFMEPVSSRTSILAVLSLVLALICFIPGSGALAVILGGAAVLFISTSGGRLRGMGLAITGIILGLLFTIFWIFLVVGVNQGLGFFANQFIKPADTTMAAVQAGDMKGARAQLTPATDKHITDAMIADFAKRYQAELGAYKGAPQSLWALGRAYGDAGQAMQSVQGRQNVIPFPATFEKGTAIIAMEIDPELMRTQPPGSSPGSFNLPLVNIGVLPVKGTPVWLVDPKDVPGLLTPPGGGGNTGGTDPNADADGAAGGDGDAKDAPKDGDAPGG